MTKIVKPEIGDTCFAACSGKRFPDIGIPLAAIHNWMSSEADRKREKKRGLRAVRGKVTPAPGGCNQKGATG
jgi:hypothetical protein